MKKLFSVILILSLVFSSTRLATARVYSASTVTKMIYGQINKRNKKFSYTVSKKSDISLTKIQNYYVSKDSYLMCLVSKLQCIGYKTPRGRKYRFTLKYNESTKETQSVQKYAKKVVKRFRDFSTPYKLQAIHDFVVNSLEYDEKCINDAGYKAIKKKRAVCNGYTALFYQLCTAARVPCYCVSGFAKNDGLIEHIWNVVKINNKYYYVDTTWDDCNDIQYAYFLKGRETFNKDHFVVLNTALAKRVCSSDYEV